MVVTVKKWALSWPVFIVSIAWLWVFSIGDIAAKTQGRLFPVVTPFVVNTVEEFDLEGQRAVRLSGTAYKLRACAYGGVTWLITTHGTQGTVRAYFQDKPQGRELGLQTWSALIVGVSASRLDLTHAKVHHTCGLFPVDTPFYVGRAL